MNSDRLSILLLCDDNPKHANTILLHINAFLSLSKHKVRMINPLGIKGNRILDFNEFDVVVIHYSLVIILDYYLHHSFREKLRRFTGLKIQFIQDDYRWVDEITAMMRYMRIQVLFTLVPKPEIPKIWDDTRLPGVIKINTLAGYVDESLTKLETLPLESRPIDVGYRGRELPYWLGRLGQEKVWIAKGFLKHSKKYNLRCDIAWSEEDRIYGNNWNKFISSCKAFLGTEGGASITDFDGSIERRVKEYLAEHQNAKFSEVYEKILKPREGRVKMNIITPRIFEAIALKTPLILFTGEYMGVIKPWIHYIPLERDFSNMPEVVERLYDTEFLRRMSEQAYNDIILSGKYSVDVFINEFDDVVSKYGYHRSRRLKIRFWISKIFIEIIIYIRRYILLPMISYMKRNKNCIKIYYIIYEINNAARNPWAVYFKSRRTVKIVFKSGLISNILFIYFRNKKKFKKIKLLTVLKELLRIDVLKLIISGKLKTEEPFYITSYFDGDKLILLSKRIVNVDAELGFSGNNNMVNDLNALKAGLKSKNISSIIWNHSAIGEYLFYKSVGDRKPLIYLGPNGLYEFKMLSKYINNDSHNFSQSLLKYILN